MSIIALGDDDGIIPGAIHHVEYIHPVNPSLVTVSNGYGQSPFFDVQQSTTGIITAKEVRTSHGRALGTLSVIDVLSSSYSTFRQLWYSIQPIAEAVSISYAASESGLIRSRPDTIDVWQIVLPIPVSDGDPIPTDPNAPLGYDIATTDQIINVPVEIATLPNSDVIESVLGYDGYAIPNNINYMTGVVIIGPTADFGEEGMYLFLNLGSYTFNGQPVVDLVHVGAGVVGSAQLQSMTDFLTDGTHVAVQLTGEINKGRWYFLVRDSAVNDGTVIAATYSPQQFPPIPVTGGGDPDAPCKKCTVPLSDTNSPPPDCSPTSPSPCSSESVTASGLLNCGAVVVVNTVGRKCTLNGTIVSKETKISQAVSVNKKGGISLGVGSTAVTAGGSYGEKRTVTETITQSYTTQGDPNIPGNCGECRKTYLQIKACSQDWKKKKDTFSVYAPTGPPEPLADRQWDRHPCSTFSTVTTTCISKETDEQSCTRTPN